MILLACLALVVLSVPLCGGSLGALARIRWQHVWLVVSAMVLQVLVVDVLHSVIPQRVGATAHLVSYGLAVTFLVVNRQVRWLWVVGVGGLANLVAITANGGVMPADPGALARAGMQLDPGEFANSTAVVDPRLPWLGDYFAVPSSWPLANVFSVGDLVLVLGTGLVLHRACGSRLCRRTAETPDESPTTASSMSGTPRREPGALVRTPR
jgi:hypothetical protein